MTDELTTSSSSAAASTAAASRATRPAAATRVGLAEMNDLASGTSSWSTKLIHGGLRYLEHYEFRLVREALMEREVLWGMAPHIIWPLRFVLPLPQGRCARPGCSASACSSTTISAAASCCRRRKTLDLRPARSASR